MNQEATLRKAASLVEQGWCQGRMATDAYGLTCHSRSSDAVAWCAMGAILAATDPVDCGEDIGVREHLVRAIAAAVGVPGIDILAWNDAPGQTAKDVAAALLRAAEIKTAVCKQEDCFDHGCDGWSWEPPEGYSFRRSWDRGRWHIAASAKAAQSGSCAAGTLGVVARRDSAGVAYDAGGGWTVSPEAAYTLAP